MDNPLTLRERLNLIIFHTHTAAGLRFDRYLLLAIMASLAVVMLDSIDMIHQNYSMWLTILEWGFTIGFAIEYGLRLYCSPQPWRYALSFFGIVDLMAILPGILAVYYPDAQYLLIIRVIRMLRIFRVLRLGNYLGQANYLLTALRSSQQKIVVFFACILTLSTVYGTLMFVIEGPAHGFTSIPTGIYWAVVTLTTVGFGDITPKTPLGQALSTLVMITGYSIIAVPTGIFTAELTSAMRANNPVLHECPGCHKERHEQNAAFCTRCGHALYAKHDEHDHPH